MLLRNQASPAFFLVWLTLESETNSLSRNVDNYQSTLRNISEELGSFHTATKTWNPVYIQLIQQYHPPPISTEVKESVEL
jgi:hypothetical protein